MIDNKLQFYQTRAGYDALKNAGNIPNDALVFIKETHDIITHGEELFGGNIEQIDARINNALGTLDSNISKAAGSDGLSLSITEVDGKITSIDGSISDNVYDSYGSASAAQSAAQNAAATDATNKVNAAKEEIIDGATLDGNTLKKIEDRVSPLESVVDTIDQKISETVSDAVSEAVSTLDANVSQTAGTDGLYLSVTETNGKITAISGSIAANTYDSYGSASDVQSAASTDATNKVNAAKTELIDGATENGNTLGKLEDRIQEESTARENAVSAEIARAQEAETALTSTKADKATTLDGYNILDAYTKSEIYTKDEVNAIAATPVQNYITVEATDQTTSITSILPATGSSDTLYTIGSWDGTQYDLTKYSEYKWDSVNNIYIKLAVHEYPGVEDKPTAGSEKLVKSGGIEEIIDKSLYSLPFYLNGYLNNSGRFQSENAAKCTDYISVNSGDVYIYSGIFADPSALFGLVFGYRSKDDNDPIILVPTKSSEYINHSFTIPSGISFIRAWSLETEEILLRKSTSIDYRVTELENPLTTVGKNNHKTMSQKAISNNIIIKDNGITRDESGYKSNGILKCYVWRLADSYKTEVEVGIAYLGFVDNSNFHFHFFYQNREIILSAATTKVNGKNVIVIGETDVIDLGKFCAVIVIDTTVFNTYIKANADEIFTTLQKKNELYHLYYNKYATKDFVNDSINDSIYTGKADYRLIADNPSAVGGVNYMCNNIVTSDDGIIRSIKFVSRSGKPFEILTAYKNGNSFRFTRRMTVVPQGTGMQEQDVFLPISKGEVLFFGEDGSENQEYPGYTTVRDVIDDNGGSWFWIRETVNLNNEYVASTSSDGVCNATYSFIQYKFKPVGVPDQVKINYITATRNASNFNSIREIISNIQDANELNQYVIIVPDGEWFECDLQGKKWVKIKGLSKLGTIIYCDGTSNKLTPSDYYYSSYRGVPLNTIDRNNKHIFMLTDDISIENLTLRAKNCKYTMHFENSGWSKVVANNVKFVGEDVLALLGYGLRGEQSCILTNCEFAKKSNDVLAIYMHNWTWRYTTDLGLPLYGGGALIHVKNSKFTNGGNLLSIGEIASMNSDKIIIENCDVSGSSRIVGSNVEMSDGIPMAIDVEGNRIQNPQDVPYCILLNIVKSDGNNITISANPNTRPNFNNMVTLVE